MRGSFAQRDSLSVWFHYYPTTLKSGLIERMFSDKFGCGIVIGCPREMDWGESGEARDGKTREARGSV